MSSDAPVVDANDDGEQSDEDDAVAIALLAELRHRAKRCLDVGDDGPQCKARRMGVRPLKRPSRMCRCCVECGTSDTSSWRRGPAGERTLCNACGQRFIRRCRKEQRALLAAAVQQAPSIKCVLNPMD